MSNRLIVESADDQFFVEAMITHLQAAEIAVEPPICQIDDFDCLGGLNDKKLFAALDSLRTTLVKSDIKKVGILLDNDGREQERLKQINSAIQSVFGTNLYIPESGAFVTVPVTDFGDVVKLQIGCFLLGVENQGELETVLRAIASESAVYADCLTGWEDCIRNAGKESFSEKEFVKLWIDAYIRWDTCSRKERKQASKNCSKRNFQQVMRKQIWDFDHPVLNDLKTFLHQFASDKALL